MHPLASAIDFVWISERERETDSPGHTVMFEDKSEEGDDCEVQNAARGNQNSVRGGRGVRGRVACANRLMKAAGNDSAQKQN